MAQSQCGWTVSKHAVCTSTESSITERSPHLSLVLLQPVCMPDFKKDKKQALRVLNIKGNIAGSLSSSSTVFILSRQHRYMSARVNPSLPPPSHLLSANGKPKPPLSPGESQPVAHTLWSHTHVTELHLHGVSFIGGLPVLLSFSLGGEVLMARKQLFNPQSNY